MDTESGVSPPSSQNMARRDAATSGTREQQKMMRVKCGHCCTGPGQGKDLHPGTAWLKCGEKSCKSINFAFHAVCHGIKIGKDDAKLFCQKFIRCNSHINRCELNIGAIASKDLVSSSDDSEKNSDADFELNPKKDKKNGTNNKKKKNTPRKVFTPGAQKLPNPAVEQSHTTSYSVDVHATHEIDSFEKLNTINIEETESHILVNHGEEDEDRAQSVAARLAAGKAKVGIVNGERVILNISPRSQVILVSAKSDKQNPLAFQPPLRSQAQVLNPKVQPPLKSPSAQPTVQSREQPNVSFQKKMKPPLSKPQPKSNQKLSKKTRTRNFMEELDEIM